MLAGPLFSVDVSFPSERRESEFFLLPRLGVHCSDCLYSIICSFAFKIPPYFTLYPFEFVKQVLGKLCVGGFQGPGLFVLLDRYRYQLQTSVSWNPGLE